MKIVVFISCSWNYSTIDTATQRNRKKLHQTGVYRGGGKQYTLYTNTQLDSDLEKKCTEYTFGSKNTLLTRFWIFVL